ncbi:MAG: hypothetical protein KAI17_10160 [Thiotrichaceae bacterium]|nr:hypothetical protein [Thiotrichaceae bacterium]
MTLSDYRQTSRRHAERRLKERRLITYPFGSIEWLNLIQQNYLLWPKEDRRQQDRRHQNRRHNQRRLSNIGRPTSSAHTKKLHNLLTEEEKQMLNQLSQSDALD